jgi:hypothetical protein
MTAGFRHGISMRGSHDLNQMTILQKDASTR